MVFGLRNSKNNRGKNETTLTDKTIIKHVGFIKDICNSCKKLIKNGSKLDARCLVHVKK